MHQGRVLVCARGTPVAVADRGFLTTTVRVLEGKHAGASGVVANEFIRRERPPTEWTRPGPTPSPPIPADPPTRFGMTAAVRQRVYWDYCEATMRVAAETDRKFGDVRERIARLQDLPPGRDEFIAEASDRYYGEVSRRYGLSRDQLTDIFAEGRAEKWPSPAR